MRGLPEGMQTGQPTKKPKLQASYRSLKYLRKLGYTAEVCEQFKATVAGKEYKDVYRGGYRKDLFGFADILAFGPGDTVLAQTTSRKQVTVHLRKYCRDEKVRQNILDWIALPGRRFVIHGWERLEVPCKTRPGFKHRWQVVERWIEPSDLVDNKKQIAAEPAGKGE